MELKRYTTSELQKICKDIFYDYMASENKLYWFDDSFQSLEMGCTTPAHQLHNDYLKIIKMTQARINMLTEALPNEKYYNFNIPREIKFLEKELYYLQNSNMSFQKEIYEKTEKTDYARSSVRISLNKKINSYYDDLILEVVYYDDVSTLSGKFEEYCKLETKYERREFIEKNTEITNMGFTYVRNKKHVYVSQILGKLNIKDKRITSLPVKLLDERFSDFENLTLADTFEVNNNDISQFLQSKINLDKEKLTLLAEVSIRGDKYSILEEGVHEVLYIRYICRSTGRVYYNQLNLDNLSLSPYFKRNKYESYAKAWWNLNTLGSNPNGDSVIRL